MEVKEIEAVRIAAGETLVIIPDHPMPTDMALKLGVCALNNGFNIMVLPHNTKVYIKERDRAPRS